MSIPRSEYPRPQFVRDEWLCLNGEWQFEIDNGDSGELRGLVDKELARKITVPFCPESKLSGINNTDFMEAVWYRRTVAVPSGWQEKIMLNFQACDYDTTVWVNGQEAGCHRGGFTPFSVEISRFVTPGSDAIIVVRARDYSREHKAGGKQSLIDYGNKGCHYDRTTGIWQTVWLEPVASNHLKRPKIISDLTNCCFRITQPLAGRGEKGLTVSAKVIVEGKVVSEASVSADLTMAPEMTLNIAEADMKLWEPGQPFLYDIELELTNASGKVIDKASSYAGMRSISLIGRKFLINGKQIFQRQVLDQGYYPDGIMTAPSEEALLNDIKLSMEAGFNAARLHQKVFEERFLYHADKLGYMVWGEFGDWGMHHLDRIKFNAIDTLKHQPHNATFRQWAEALERDFNHPSIVGWCPLNESHQNDHEFISSLEDLTCGLYQMTKLTDPTRPVLDSSGYTHFVVDADIYDSHNYQQDPKLLAEDMAGLAEEKPYVNPQFHCAAYFGQPYFCSEFGGIKWAPEFADNNWSESWGYGEAPKSLEEFYARFEGLINVLLDDPNMFGYCYTQLTDVFQEQNGIYNFDRSTKFDMEKIHAIQTKVAACEQQSE